MNGIVRRFNEGRGEGKGYGFIAPMIGKPDTTPLVFFHASAIKRLQDGRRQTIPAGAEVRFRLVRGDRGPQAADVEAVQLPSSALKSLPKGGDQLCR